MIIDRTDLYQEAMDSMRTLKKQSIMCALCVVLIQRNFLK